MKAITSIIAAALLTTSAAAHEWYDPACCSGKDCAAVAIKTVASTPDGWLVTPDGWLVTLAPGDHPMISAPVQYLVPYGDRKERRSQDEDFHACIGAVSGTLFCLYTPPMSF